VANNSREVRMELDRMKYDKGRSPSRRKKKKLRNMSIIRQKRLRTGKMNRRIDGTVSVGVEGFV